MKRKPPLVAKISEDRILQLSNDMSEDMASGTTAEWRAVALYFRNEVDDQQNRINAMRGEVITFSLAFLAAQRK